MNGKCNETEAVTVKAVEEAVHKTMDYSKESYRLKGKKLAIWIILTVMTCAGTICLIIGIPILLVASAVLYIIGRSLKKEP